MIRKMCYNEREEYTFEKSGELTMEVIEEYLENIQSEARAIDMYEKPFDEDLLSDEKLGISEAESENIDE